MALPVWVAGQVLTASDVNTYFVPRAVVKPGNQSVTSSTTMVNDSALVLPVDANAIYEMHTHLIYDGDSAGDLKVGWTGPAGASLDWMSMALTIGTAAINDTTSHTANSTLAGPALIGCLGAGTSIAAPLQGILQIAGTAGNFQMQWAQNSSFATATRVLANSTLILRRIG